MPVSQRSPLLETSLLDSKEETLQALVRGWMGLAQLNNKTWPQPKDVPSLASHLASQNASIDWARIHEWVQVRADLPDENPPEGVEASHWGIDRALYGLVKNRRATLASLEETLREVAKGTSGDEDSPEEDEDAVGSPAPSDTPLPSHDAEDCTSPASEVDPTPSEHPPRARREHRSLHGPSSASRSRASDGDNSAPRTLEVSSKAPAAPTVSHLQVHSVQPWPREVVDPEQEGQSFRDMLVAIFQEYSFEPKSPCDGDIPVDDEFFPSVALVGNGTIKVHGWDHRPCYGFPNGRSIYWPLTNIPLRYDPDLRQLMVTTKDVAKGLAKHTTCIEGNIYFHIVYRTPTMLQLIPFAAIDCDQTLRVTDNYWTDLTVGEIEGDIPLLEDIKLLLEIRILPAFKSIPPAPTKRMVSVENTTAPEVASAAVEETTAVPMVVDQDKGPSARARVARGGAPATTKSRSRKTPIKHRELYLEWLRKTKWESKVKTNEIREMGKYARQQFPALLGLVNFISELIKDACFTDSRADPLIQFKIVPMGVFADFLNHGEEWVNNCLLIKRKLPLCNHLPAMGKAIRQAAKHGLGISTVVDAINSSLGGGRKRKRAEGDGSGSDDGDDGDGDDDDDDDDGSYMAVDDVLASLEGEDWLRNEDENEESDPLEDDADSTEWHGFSA